MAGIVLNVEVREHTGSGAARATRNAEMVPGVLYGGARGAVPIALQGRELAKALRSGKFVSHMIEIDHKGERQPVIPKAIQYHPVSDAPIHVDLYRVEENTIIDVDVVVHFTNHDASPGLKRGATLNIASHTVQLHCPAGSIPEEIVVDLTGKEIGDVIHAADLPLPKGVTLSVKSPETIATIAGKGGKADAADDAADAAAEAEATTES